VKIFIHRVKEVTLGINQNASEKYRMDNQIPDIDVLYYSDQVFTGCDT
jgi:hypothetical protein